MMLGRSSSLGKWHRTASSTFCLRVCISSASVKIDTPRARAENPPSGSSSTKNSISIIRHSFPALREAVRDGSVTSQAPARVRGGLSQIRCLLPCALPTGRDAEEGSAVEGRSRTGTGFGTETILELLARLYHTDRPVPSRAWDSVAAVVGMSGPYHIARSGMRPGFRLGRGQPAGHYP